MGYIKNPSDNGQFWRESAANDSASVWHGFDSKNNGKDKFFKSETLPNDPKSLIASGAIASSGDRFLAGVYGDLPKVSLWTPAKIATSLWLDASDPATITESVGSVSQWDDKSGNGNNVIQASGVNQPETGVRDINGLNVLDFDGSDSMTRGALASRSDDFIVVGVWYVDFVISSRRKNTMFAQSGISQDWNMTTSDIVLQSDGSDAYSGGVLAGVSSIISYDVNFSGLNTEAFINGSSEANVVMSQSVGNSTTNIGIGFTASNFNFFGGMGEIIISNDRSVSTRQKIEGYLAWKWDQVSKLPADHPYKNVPPC
jgi:hypothetical protein